MTVGGWIFMITSLTVVLGTATWAYSKLLRAPRRRND